MKNTIEIQIALSWVAGNPEAEQEAERLGSFDVSLNASTAEDVPFIEMPRTSFRLDLPALQALIPQGDAYAEALSEQLFAIEGLRDAFIRMATVADTEDIPLHVRLMLDRLAPAECHTVRWEQLLDPRDADPIALKPKMTLTRFVTPRTTRTISLRAKSDLRALIVAADPEPASLANYGEFGGRGAPLAQIESRMEAERAAECLEPIKSTILCERGKATLDGITTALRDADRHGRGYDIVYLIAHGALHRQGPVLYLDSESGQVAPVSGAQFAEAITTLDRPPMLVVLSSCETAASKPGASVTSMGDAAVALGPMLSGDGISTVIGMHGQVTVDTVQDFMPRFFTTLQETGSVFEAMQVARLAVRNRRDWWAPVLLTRLRTGIIWYTPGFLSSTNAPSTTIFVQAMKSNRCTPIIGPRLSSGFFPDRQSIARGLATRLQVPMTPGSSNDLARVSQYLAVAHDTGYPPSILVDYLTERVIEDSKFTTDEVLAVAGPPDDGSPGGRLNTLISEIGRRQRAKDADDPYTILAALPFPVYFTTSFTTLLEDALDDAGRTAHVIHFPWHERGDGVGSTPQPNARTPIVVRLFGGFDDPDSMVLTEDDYFKYLTTWSKAKGQGLKGLQSRLTSNNLLMMGFGLDDWDFRVLFRSIFTMGGASALLPTKAHVAVQVTPESDFIEADAVQDYLEHYYISTAAKFAVRWGTPAEVLTELRDQWAR